MTYTNLSLLIVEDQEAIAENIAEFLEPRGHTLDFAWNGLQGLELALKNPYDVVVLDLMLPQMDGLKICETLRKRANRHIPILMLTARDGIDDKIAGFGHGADDYLTKPFALEELELRCLVLSRRHLLNTEHVIKLGPLRIDRKKQEVKRDGKIIPLGDIGYKIIEALAEAYPRTVSRSELIQKIWQDEPTESDTLRSHMYQIRNILDKPFSYPILKTVHSVGFALNVED